MNEIIEQGPLAVFFALAVGHAIADFPLQSEYLAKQKNRHLADSKEEWVVALTAHALIHAGAVWLITGSMLCGVVELVLHALIDLGKSERKFGLLADQMLHLVCKLGYVLLLAF